MGKKSAVGDRQSLGTVLAWLAPAGAGFYEGPIAFVHVSGDQRLVTCVKAKVR
jgi:hypothetical protein